MSYSASIARLVKNFLDEDDWHYSFDNEKGIFTFNLNLKNKLNKVSYQVLVRDTFYVVYAICPMNADDCKAEMAEFISRANYGLFAGNFEFDFRDGEIRYKCYVGCNDTTPGKEEIRKSIYVPGSMFNRYGEGIVAVLFGLKSAEQAIKDCEADL